MASEPPPCRVTVTGMAARGQASLESESDSYWSPIAGHVRKTALGPDPDSNQYAKFGGGGAYGAAGEVLCGGGGAPPKPFWGGWGGVARGVGGGQTSMRKM